jgi:hypothetical protein
MTIITTTCRRCSAEFAPSHESIRAGSWRVCPTCQPQPSDEPQCERCGRVLQTKGRRLCLSCLGGDAL